MKTKKDVIHNNHKSKLLKIISEVIQNLWEKKSSTIFIAIYNVTKKCYKI